ncbi:MAG TPA: beta-xylosidase, partial [Verrucomicrobiae bacterium]|nr:beta-xylosidase [Verrucomicrobiae bacterium]
MRLIQLCCLFATLYSAAADNSFPVAITVDAARPLGDLTPIWRFFGADEPNYACMKDGK